MAASPHAEHAKEIGLEIVPVDDLTILREPAGDGFSFTAGPGARAPGKKRLAEIEALVLPPNWQDVRIAPSADWHIQAVGKDEAGRLQYRYHDDWTRVRNRVKAQRLLDFGRALPALRKKVDQDVRSAKLTKSAVAATAIRLIDRQLIRPGHEQYTANGTAGAATLSGRHVSLEDDGVELSYKGKSGKQIDLAITDKMLRRRLKSYKSKNHGRLFRYRTGRRKRPLSAQDINDYMRRATGRSISAKDFRTFGGSAMALAELCRLSKDEPDKNEKRALSATMKSVAKRLRNTPAVTRSSYVHPSIVDYFEDGVLDPGLIAGRLREGLSREETALMRFLEAGLR